MYDGAQRRRHRGSLRPGDEVRTRSKLGKLAECMTTITGYHAHVYFDAATREQARLLCEAAGAKFPITVGRMHDKPVGPHPRGSCQLAFGPEHFGAVIPWLLTHRNGLTVFVHASSGDDLKDHTEHVLWLGPSEALDLTIFSR
jgi:DOPA 4,5-dioxygenase